MSDEDDSNSESNSISLPLKSKGRYEAYYKSFLTWCERKKIKDYTEEVMIEYFSERAARLKFSSLWSIYSQIKATLHFHKHIDISKYPRLVAFVKEKSKGQKTEKLVKYFTYEEIEKFLEKAPDKEFLMDKVALIMGISGALRTTELFNLTIDSVQEIKDNFLVSIKDVKTNRNRLFTIVSIENSAISFLELCKKYMSLRDPSTPHTRFFVAYSNGKCAVKAVGKNVLGRVPAKIASYLKLSNAALYTGHSYRCTSEMVLANPGSTMALLKPSGVLAKDGNLDNSSNNQNQDGNANKNADSVSKEDVPNLTFSNCEDCNVHVNLISRRE